MLGICNGRNNKVAAEQRLLDEQVAEENEAFQTDAAFDLSSRERFKDFMREPQTYTAEEDAIVADGQQLFALEEMGAMRMKRVKTQSPLLKDAAAFVSSDSDDVYGCVRCTVHERPSRTSSRTRMTGSRGGS
jgi:hypothetical protein